MEFRILGPLDVRERGQSIPLGGSKQRALLAILLINANELVSVDRLVDDLWGESVPDRALNAVQVYVSHLRKILASAGVVAPKDVLLTTPPGYTLSIGVEELDLGRFRRLAGEGRAALEAEDPSLACVRLRDALVLWRGPALADFQYEPFAQVEIERLEELRLSALEDRIEADLALGRHRELAAELDQLVRERPHREGFRAQLMLALYRAGRQAEALEQYQQGRALLVEELGVDPSRAVEQLYEAILRQDRDLDPPSAHGPTEVPTKEVNATIERATQVGERELPVPPASEEAADGLGEGEVVVVASLFADVVGSTALAERLPAEEVAAVIGECMSRMSRVVEEFGGMIQAYMGDGIAAYFGMPRPHEDDAVRASRAALRLLEVVEVYADEVERAWGIREFGVRVGVNLGRVAVGRVGAAVPQTVAFGDPMNVAARLESTAGSGWAVIGDAVVRRLPPEFVVEPLEDRKVKGRGEPVRAARLLGIQPSAPVVPSTPLVGRRGELERLRGAVGELVDGRGQVVLIAGEAGIGKSRLVAEGRGSDAGDPRWFEGRCRAYEGERRFRPFVDILQGWLGVGDGDAELIVRTKLRASLAALMPEEADAILPYLSRMLDLPVDPAQQEAIGAEAPAALAGSIRGAFRTWVECMCTAGPVALILEDVHHADQGSRMLGEELLEVTDSHPLLLVLTSRHAPGSPGWQLWMRVLERFRHRAVEIELLPLSSDEARTMIDMLTPTGGLDESSVELVVGRAEGNPLYLEELVRTVTDADALERTRGWTLTMSTAGVLLPPALESLLMVRVQNLADGPRRLAQMAAVIGREFPLSILEAVTSPDDVREHLPVLLRSEVVRELRRYPEPQFTFKHGLLQDAALAGLTSATMKDLYGRVGEAYVAVYSDSLEERSEALAFYYYRSDDQRRAIPYLEAAAANAASLDDPGRARTLWERVRRVGKRIDEPDIAKRATAALQALEASSSTSDLA